MKMIVLAVILLLVSVPLMASCPMSVKCLEDGMMAFYKGIRFSATGKCLCEYSHQWGGQTHNIVTVCD